MEKINTDDVLIMPGGAIKARREVKADGRNIGIVTGVLCRFTDADATDWYGDYFDADTDFRFIEGMTCAIYFDHGANSIVGKRCLAVGTLHLTELGIEVRAELDLNDPISLAIYERAEKGELGWSSGTAGHLVDSEQVKSYALHGESAYHITHWPLGLDASLTPNPAEESNRVEIQTLKSIKSARASEEKNEIKGVEIETVETAIAGDVAAVKSALDALRLQAIRMQGDVLRMSLAR